MEETIAAVCVYVRMCACVYTQESVCVCACNVPSLCTKACLSPMHHTGPCLSRALLSVGGACLFICVCVWEGGETICCGVQRGRRCSEMVHVGVVVGRGAEPGRCREGIKRYWGRKHGCVCMVGDVGQFLEGTHCPS